MAAAQQQKSSSEAAHLRRRPAPGNLVGMRPEFLVAMERLGVPPHALERALGTVPFGVLVSHVEDGCIYASDEVLRMFDMDWNAFRGFGWMSAVIPADVEALRATFERYQQDKTEIEVQYRIAVRDGSTRAVVATASPVLDANDEQIGSVVVGRLATLERALAEQSTRSQKLEAIGRLAGRVAHDFNNVLTPIICSASLLEHEQLTDEEREYVATIVQGAQHAAAMTRQLLGLSRPSEDTASLSNLDAEIGALRTMLIQLLGEQVELTLDLQSPGAWVGLAPHEIGQVLLNLCVNGRDAIGDSGRVTVTTRRDRAFVECRVRDSGTGITRAVQERMFEPFYTTKAPDRGTGLGLSTARDLVRRAGGDITVRSSLGSGTQMIVRVPSLASTRTADPAGNRRVEMDPQRILIVDDNAALRQTLASVLARSHHEVTTCASVARASQWLGEVAFDVLITDVLLPDGRGDALASAALEALGELRVVFITGFGGDDVVLSAHRSARCTVLHKPFHPDDMTDAIAQVLRADLAVGSP